MSCLIVFESSSDFKNALQKMKIYLACLLSLLGSCYTVQYTVAFTISKFFGGARLSSSTRAASTLEPTEGSYHFLDVYNNSNSNNTAVYDDHSVVTNNTYAFEKVGIYGEILPSSLSALLSCLNISDDDVVYDLGSGVGKAIIQFAYETKVSKAIGIELGRNRHIFAMNALEKLMHGNSDSNSSGSNTHSSKITFINGDLLDSPWDEKATILFINAFCFPDYLMDEIEYRIRNSHSKIKYILLFGQRFGVEYRSVRDDNTTCSISKYADSQQEPFPFVHSIVPCKMSFNDENDYEDVTYCELYTKQ